MIIIELNTIKPIVITITRSSAPIGPRRLRNFRSEFTADRDPSSF